MEMGVRTLLALVVLKRFESSECRAPCNKFVSKAGFMFLLFKVVVLVDLLVILFVPVCRM
jgi:hypothetical protein